MTRSFLMGLAVFLVLVGAVCLGLGVSALDYINYERAQAHMLPHAAFYDCKRFFVLGALFCLGGLVLWAIGKRLRISRRPLSGSGGDRA